MKSKHWWFFAAVQIVGITATADMFLIPFGPFILISWIMLLPGSVLSFLFAIHSQNASNWTAWIACAIAISANTLLMAVASMLIAKFRKPD